MMHIFILISPAGAYWDVTGQEGCKACLLCWRGPAGIAHVEEAEGYGILICGLPLHSTEVDCPGIDAGWRSRLEPAQPEAMSI